jgi:hypothetical protein
MFSLPHKIYQSVFALWIALFIAPAGCVSGPQTPPDELIVERSELGRPRWVDAVTELEPSSEKWFLHSGRQLQRLDLGIRQTQAGGLALHCKLLAERVKLEISSAVEQVEQSLKTSKGDKTSSAESDQGRTDAIAAAVNKVSQSKECPELEAKDVYWEAVRRQTSEGPRTSYDVYVLLRLRTIHFDEVLAMAVDSLTLSGRADLQPVAEVLKGRMSTSSQRGTNE